MLFLICRLKMFVTCQFGTVPHVVHHGNGSMSMVLHPDAAPATSVALMTPRLFTLNAAGIATLSS